MCVWVGGGWGGVCAGGGGGGLIDHNHATGPQTIAIGGHMQPILVALVPPATPLVAPHISMSLALTAGVYPSPPVLLY